MPTAKILIVDDEPGIRYFLQETLTEDGYRVVAAESGEAALERIAVEEFDLALVDLKMKRVGGLEVLAALRRRSPDTTTIVLTAHASLETAIEALRQGAHDYLFKPCGTDELRQSVRTGLLKRQRETRQRETLARLEHNLTSSLEEIRASVSSGPDTPTPAHSAPHSRLNVDETRQVITLDGHALDLSRTEFDLLVYLARHAPRVVAPQELVRQVQGYECEAWEAREILRSHISNLRAKIRAATGRTDVVRTVRGKGYAIDEEAG